ncbi:hypothetical protein MLD38_031181 [Melastoma candidum]|uniref:Uncharacterized protein n=1 Tax=Melastoma candidum TaxID=119954 RepID=A0ACB9MQI1_9MYRT|nr:hypothetical protein MLD38_031181 [Melastoma candidum]
MDLDDLEDLAPAPRPPPHARPSKFAPKSALKNLPKPKTQPLPELSEPEPPPHLEASGADDGSRAAKRENGLDDSPATSVLVLDSLAKVEPAIGEVEMELDCRIDETKADVMEEEQAGAYGGRQDEVVREIDVFFNPSLDDCGKTQLYVMQYPLRPWWRPYDMDERCQEVRVKPSSSEVEIDLSIDTDSKNYNNECEGKLMMVKQTLSSSWKPPLATGYAVGILMENKLYLNPLDAVVQLRPSMEHLNLDGSNRKNNVLAHKEVDMRVTDSIEEKVGGSSKNEHWIKLEYHDSRSDISAKYLQGMKTETTTPIPFTMKPHDYVHSLCPGASTQNVKTEGSSKRILLSIPVDERIKKILCEGFQIHRYSALRHYAPDVSDDVLLGVLQQNALLVQGCWVPKTKLFFELSSAESMARDYTLLLYSKKRVIHEKEISAHKKFYDPLKRFLNLFGIGRKTLHDWKFKQELDSSFVKNYPDVVCNQEKIWLTIETKLMERLNQIGVGNRLKRSGDDSRTAGAIPTAHGRAGRPSSLDNLSVRTTNGPATGKMTAETREALPKALQKIFQNHKVCSLQLICESLRDLAVSQSTLPKADARMAIAAAYGVDAPPNELKEIINQVAAEIHGLYVLKASPEHPELDPLRKVVIDLLRGKGPNATLKKAEIFEAASKVLGRSIANNEYTKVINDLCESRGSLWYLKESR